MDLDGNNQEILTNNMQGNTKMCIYDGYLYYTYRNENGEKSGHRQNLETGEEEDLGAHIFRDGNVICGFPLMEKVLCGVFQNHAIKI